MPIAAPSRSFLYTIAVALFVNGWLSVNIYLPILPHLEKVFDIGRSTASLTVTVFLIGFSVTQLVWGPLSDRFGRKPILLCGLAISVTGAVLAACANSIEFFMGARILESVGIGVAPVLARSVLTDSLDRDHVSTAMAYVAIVVAIVHSRSLPLCMAGAPGFEPGMRESKSRALTTWLRPNMTLAVSP